MDTSLADFQALRAYDRRITFKGERIFRQEADDTEIEISHEVYHTERHAAEARENAARAAFKELVETDRTPRQ